MWSSTRTHHFPAICYSPPRKVFVKPKVRIWDALVEMHRNFITVCLILPHEVHRLTRIAHISCEMCPTIGIHLRARTLYAHNHAQFKRIHSQNKSSFTIAQKIYILLLWKQWMLNFCGQMPQNVSFRSCRPHNNNNWMKMMGITRRLVSQCLCLYSIRTVSLLC